MTHRVIALAVTSITSAEESTKKGFTMGFRMFDNELSPSQAKKLVHYRRRVVGLTLVTSVSVLFAGLSVVTPTLAQTPVEFGSNTQQNLACGATNVYTFSAEAGDRVVIHATSCGDFGGVCGGVACCCFDLCYELWSPGGELLNTSNCVPQTNNCSHRRRNKMGPEWLPEQGVYEIRIRDSTDNGRGTFRLAVQRTNLPGRAQPLNSGDSLLVPLEGCGEVDSYEFTASANDWVSLVMTTEDGSIDPKLELFEPSGLAVALPESGTIEQTLGSAGLYTLLAFSNVHETGTYRLDFDLVPSEQCIDADADGFGSPGRISCPNGAATDCDDSSTCTYPGAIEILDGVDNDCDNQIDEDVDQDSDGVPDLLDSCPGTPSGCGVTADGCLVCILDGDGDAFECTTDCNDQDPLAHGLPIEVASVVLEHVSGDAVRISWQSQDAAAGTGTVYDVVRGSLDDLRSSGTFNAAACAVANHPDSPYEESRPLATGLGEYFLVLAKNSCGRGTHGQGSIAPDPRADLDSSPPCQ